MKGKTTCNYCYKVELLNEINKIEENEFEILDKKYKWFSFEELERDERIKKVNSDIVNYVKEFNI